MPAAAPTCSEQKPAYNHRNRRLYGERGTWPPVRAHAAARFRVFGGGMLGPIFVRELLARPRRARHYVPRTLCLGLLWILALTAWQATVGWEQPATLGDTARFGLLLFHVLTWVQLVLLMFFAALSAASTIAQEKDRRTFILLLVTDLRDYEIVLGKLLGSLLPIGLLLAASI